MDDPLITSTMRLLSHVASMILGAPEMVWDDDPWCLANRNSGTAGLALGLARGLKIIKMRGDTDLSQTNQGTSKKFINADFPGRPRCDVV